MQKITLNGMWKMWETEEQKQYPVKIPGTVLSCLLDNEAIPDPYYRKNEYDTRDLFWKDYCFERTFTVAEEFLGEEEIELVCHSLDTFAEIYLNDELLAETDSMHRTWVFPVKKLLKAGENTLRILFLSALQKAKDIPHEEHRQVHYISPVTTENNEMIRKAHSMFGWDWGAQLVDAGIQREIELVAYSRAKIEDVLITQEHQDGEVTVQVNTKIQNKGGLHKVEVELVAPDGEKDSQMVSIADEAVVTFEVKAPALWWPNGYGEQPLYDVTVKLMPEADALEEKVLEEKTYRIGLRTLTVSQEKDQWGEEFAFCVNGVKIFAMGANYIPQDCVYPRITKDRIETLVKDCVRANYNCLRYWGGGYYPSDELYDLCDEYGLIVWQDLMFACNTYEFNEEFEASVIEEVKDNVRRLRHHACLGLWCGNNELETAWVNWTDFADCSEYMREDYIRQFEHVLPKVVKKNDSQTFYWRSSPSSGGCFDDPNDENRGDVHYWEVWHGQKPFTDYRNFYFRFCSEFGFQSFPCPKTVYTYTEPEDRNIFSDVMESHQKNSSANGKILYYLSENFRYPKDFESLIYVSQVLQALAMKYGVEHWRRNRGRCMGALYWQINDEWPVASWSSIDYFGRWKALHYFARNFYSPLAGSLERDGNVVKAFVENETLESAEFEVELCLKTMDFQVLDKRTVKGVADSLSAKEVLCVDYSEILKEHEVQEVFCVATYTYGDGRVQQETETFVPYKHLRLRKANIQVETTEKDDKYVISISSDVFAGYVALDLDGADAVFSDNFIIITGPKPIEIILEKGDIRNGEVQDAKALKEMLQICSIRDSYV